MDPLLDLLFQTSEAYRLPDCIPGLFLPMPSH